MGMEWGIVSWNIHSFLLPSSYTLPNEHAVGVEFAAGLVYGHLYKAIARYILCDFSVHFEEMNLKLVFT